MSERSEKLFADYASAHATRGNRVCHLVGIPLILLSVVLALSGVPISGFWRASEPVAAAFAILAVWLDPGPGLAVAAFLAVSDLAGRRLAAGAGARWELPAAVFLFTLGWIFQLIGHSVFEKNRPAFLRNLRHLLVGPLWIAREIFSIT